MFKQKMAKANVGVVFVSPLVKPDFGDTESMCEWVEVMKRHRKQMTPADFEVYTAARVARNMRILYDKRRLDRDTGDAYSLKMREKERVSHSRKLYNFSIFFIS